MPKRPAQIVKSDDSTVGEIVVYAHRLHGNVVLSGDDDENGRRYIERAQRWFETQPEQLALWLADADEIRRDILRLPSRAMRGPRKV